MKHRKHKLRFGDLERLESRVVLSAVSPVADDSDALELLEFRRAAQFGRELRIGERVAEFRASEEAEWSTAREQQSRRPIEAVAGRAMMKLEALGITSVDFTNLAERVGQTRNNWINNNAYTPALAREDMGVGNSGRNPPLELSSVRTDLAPTDLEHLDPERTVVERMDLESRGDGNWSTAASPPRFVLQNIELYGPRLPTRPVSLNTVVPEVFSPTAPSTDVDGLTGQSLDLRAGEAATDHGLFAPSLDLRYIHAIGSELGVEVDWTDAEQEFGGLVPTDRSRPLQETLPFLPNDFMSRLSEIAQVDSGDAADAELVEALLDVLAADQLDARSNELGSLLAEGQLDSTDAQEQGQATDDSSSDLESPEEVVVATGDSQPIDAEVVFGGFIDCVNRNLVPVTSERQSFEISSVSEIRPDVLVGKAPLLELRDEIAGQDTDAEMPQTAESTDPNADTTSRATTLGVSLWLLLSRWNGRDKRGNRDRKRGNRPWRVTGAFRRALTLIRPM